MVKQARGEKVIIFKKRRRQNSRRKNGHRQHVTVLRVSGITADGHAYPAEAEHEVQATARQVAEITGEPPTTLRPPFGRYDEGTRALGPLVLWDVNPQDWRHRSSARTVAGPSPRASAASTTPSPRSTAARSPRSDL